MKALLLAVASLWLHVSCGPAVNSDVRTFGQVGDGWSRTLRVWHSGRIELEFGAVGRLTRVGGRLTSGGAGPRTAVFDLDAWKGGIPPGLPAAIEVRENSVLEFRRRGTSGALEASVELPIVD